MGPVKVAAIDDFSLDQVERAAQMDAPYTVGLIFSTKYAPHGWSLGRRNEEMDARYFGFHRDVGPAMAARLLGGHVVWHEERGGQWAAVLHFDRPAVARLEQP